LRFFGVERDYLTQRSQAAKNYRPFFAALRLGVSLFPLMSDKPDSPKGVTRWLPHGHFPVLKQRGGYTAMSITSEGLRWEL
jgi:hypothetical protein